jgi:diaminopimelate decarboxylase
MNHFEAREGELWCEQVPLAALAEAVGTPLYVYSTATLERHYRVFREALEAFPRLGAPLIAYAVKANSNLSVLATLGRLGAGADTVSEGEIRRALAAGIPPARIVYSGVGKTAGELIFALEAGVAQINIESEPELRLLAELAQARGARPDLVIRVNPDVEAGGHAKISTGARGNKFGVSLAEAERLYALAARDPRLNPVGVACHIGSQITDLAPLARAFSLMRQLIERLRARGLVVQRLDLGGGPGLRGHGRRGGGRARHRPGVRTRARHRGQRRGARLAGDPCARTAGGPAIPGAGRGDERPHPAGDVRRLPRHPADQAASRTDGPL